MTDEEKAKEYVNNVIKGYEEYFTENEIFSMITCYKDGLAEGRKENILKECANDCKIPEGCDVLVRYELLEKENAELKKELQDYQFNYDNIKELTNENAELSNSVLEFSNSVIELTNSKTELESKVAELGKQIEKMKHCWNCENRISGNHHCVDCQSVEGKTIIRKNWELAE